MDERNCAIIERESRGFWRRNGRGFLTFKNRSIIAIVVALSKRAGESHDRIHVYEEILPKAALPVVISVTYR